MKQDFKQIARAFSMDGTYESCVSYGSGHINETYLLRTREADAPDYILQKINKTVFRDVPGLMDNIRKVTSHLHRKLLETGTGNPDREILTLIPSVEGHPYHLDSLGNYWRMYLFIWPNRSYDIVPDGDVAFEGGRMFGKFQYLLSDLPGDELVETIPWFHHIGKRLETFQTVLEKDEFRRAASVRDEISFVEKHRDSMFSVLLLGEKGLIPHRVTHNDTKFNNVLLDESNRGLCVIDLDTVMPGYVHYDFGDTIRTATNKGAEDERDLSKVETDTAIFRGFARGFLGETRSILTDREKENLVFSGQLVTFTIGLRFLTDYLDGDRYFRTHREGHNLDRCRVQFKLVRSLMEREEEMNRIVEEILKG